MAQRTFLGHQPQHLLQRQLLQYIAQGSLTDPITMLSICSKDMPFQIQNNSHSLLTKGMDVCGYQHLQMSSQNDIVRRIFGEFPSLCYSCIEKIDQQCIKFKIGYVDNWDNSYFVDSFSILKREKHDNSTDI